MRNYKGCQASGSGASEAIRKNHGRSQISGSRARSGNAPLDRGRQQAGGVTSAVGQGPPAVLVPSAGWRAAGRGTENRLRGGIGGVREHHPRLFRGCPPVRVATNKCFGCRRGRATAWLGLHVLVGLSAK